MSTRPRVWLAAGSGSTPVDYPTVRDNRLVTWQPGSDGWYHTTDGWHHATWTELHARFDLVEIEIPSPRLPDLGQAGAAIVTGALAGAVR